MVTEYGKGAPAAEVATRADALVDRAWRAWRRGDAAGARRTADEAWAALAGIDAADEGRLPVLESVGKRLDDLEALMADRPGDDAAGIDRLLAWVEGEQKRPEPPGSLDRLLDRLDEELGPVDD